MLQKTIAEQNQLQFEQLTDIVCFGSFQAVS